MKEGVWPLMRRLADALASRWPVALRDAISVGIPLPTGALSHHARYGALASIGSFTGFYGAQAPGRHRIRLVAGVGLTLTVLMPLGSLCARTAWLSVLLVGLVAAGASFVCLALRVPPPREYLIVLAVLAATGIPASPAGRCWRPDPGTTKTPPGQAEPAVGGTGHARAGSSVRTTPAAAAGSRGGGGTAGAAGGDAGRGCASGCGFRG